MSVNTVGRLRAHIIPSMLKLHEEERVQVYYLVFGFGE